MTAKRKRNRPERKKQRKKLFKNLTADPRAGYRYQKKSK